MKKILMLLLIMAAAFTVTAQSATQYIAYKTEIVRKYKWQMDYETVRTHETYIPITLTGTTLYINAENPTSFVLGASENTMDTERLAIITFKAYEFSRERNCTVDFVYMKKTKESIIGVNYSDEDGTKYALHYFIKK